MEIKPLKTVVFLSMLCFMACAEKQDKTVASSPASEDGVYVIQASDYEESNLPVKVIEDEKGTRTILDGEGWLSYQVKIEKPGRYQLKVKGENNSIDTTHVWVEDYIDNEHGRNYDISGPIYCTSTTDGPQSWVKTGSPLNKGVHKIKFHYNGKLDLNHISLKLIKEQVKTPTTMTQNMDGDQWQIAWSDEFDARELDTTKWTYDIGDWGWGNKELQYYTVNDTNNVRLKNGHLIIEAKKNDRHYAWSSARLTTRGKTSFLYGRIEFKAKVPSKRGNWAAGWTLGDSYVDELSWPFCGEIDIMESVGYEMNDETGDGKAHASAHTGAYYFKLDNHKTSTLDVMNMEDEFHIYAVEWTPDEIRAYVDDTHYYTYDYTANELEWPFSKPQNIILNLAMGGGWGGAQGMDPDITSQKMIIDYVRVYERK